MSRLLVIVIFHTLNWSNWKTDAGSKNRTTTSSNDWGGWKPYATSIIIDELEPNLSFSQEQSLKRCSTCWNRHGTSGKSNKKPFISRFNWGVFNIRSDDEETRRNQKSILERKVYPAFEIIIEINDQNSWTIHEDVRNVDLFRGILWLGRPDIFFFNREMQN
jgi:hypothetical protein